MIFNSKNHGKRCFFIEAKASISFILIKGNMFMLPNHWKKKRLLYESALVQIEERILILKMVKKDIFLIKLKHEYHLSE